MHEMKLQNTRRFPPPWRVEQIPGGYKVLDTNGQSLAYVYGRETRADADTAGVLTMDEARRVAANIAKLPNYLAALTTRSPLAVRYCRLERRPWPVARRLADQQAAAASKMSSIWRSCAPPVMRQFNRRPSQHAPSSPLLNTFSGQEKTFCGIASLRSACHARRDSRCPWRESIGLRRGVFTMGSPFKLNEVFSRTGIPVSASNSWSSR
jgi:hypothetical protein